MNDKQSETLKLLENACEPTFWRMNISTEDVDSRNNDDMEGFLKLCVRYHPFLYISTSGRLMDWCRSDRENGIGHVLVEVPIPITCVFLRAYQDIFHATNTHLITEKNITWSKNRYGFPESHSWLGIKVEVNSFDVDRFDVLVTELMDHDMPDNELAEAVFNDEATARREAVKMLREEVEKKVNKMKEEK